MIDAGRVIIVDRFSSVTKMKSKTGLFALGFFTLASLFVVIAFVSPYWLVTDGKLKNPKFIKIGK